MKRPLAAAVLALLACAAAHAIPPPWTIEEAKAKAKLVVIAKIGRIEPAGPGELQGALNRRVALEPVQILKGKRADAAGYILYGEPAHPGGRLRAVSVGGLGQPKIRQGETALIFLGKHPKSNDFIVRGGSFGYLVLNADSKDELAAIEQRLALHARFCNKLKDDAVRAELQGYYAAALEFAGKELDRPQAVADAPDIARAQNAFALALYQRLRGQAGNLFFSPFSVHTALAMTWAGARGRTETEMAHTLRLPLDRERVHPAVAALVKNLHQANSDKVEMVVANALWGQKGEPFLQAFLDTLHHAYAADLRRVDFIRAAEPARRTINAWVEKQTRDRIKDLIAPGILDPATVLVLTNAIYFKGRWAAEFDPARTRDAPFHLSTERSVTVPMMYLKKKFAYAQGDPFQALVLPYAGDTLSMVVLLPRKPDGLPELELSLSVPMLDKIIASARKQKVDVCLPRFKMTVQFRLEKALAAMGMPSAFTDAADFSGMNSKRNLLISAVIHKAFVEVNEEGTEAAAATAVVMARTSISSSPIFRADRPFLFLIRHNQTGAILFMGRCANPLEPGE